jgi:ATP-dependent exoDNAse (exonuclease V) alpha subunit
LPPIGRGRVFADIIDWLEANQPESVGHLTVNIRQMENVLSGRGTGILDLAALYVRQRRQENKSSGEDSVSEEMLRRIQEGGDVDQDLRVLYWRDAADLETQLVTQIIADLEADTGMQFDADRPERLWLSAVEGEDRRKQPEYMQVVSPYRGEQFGTESLNRLLQGALNGKNLQDKGQIGGITLFDKVIQIRNRPKSNPVSAYNTSARKSEKLEVFNGEIGFAEPHLWDCKRNSYGRARWTEARFTIQRLQAVFSRKPEHRIEFTSNRFVEENLELAYAISVHKAQGSEFRRVYFILPKNKRALLSREMLYTGLTRGTQHCTVFAEEDVLPFISMRRPESSHLAGLNSSLFVFEPVPDALLQLRDWYEEGKIHRTLTSEMVRSKSEVIISNMLFERDIPFRYEVPLFAPDGSFYLPDFTVTWAGETWYWEHLGMMDRDEYRASWARKKEWYDRFFPGRLVVTEESANLSTDADAAIQQHFA